MKVYVVIVTYNPEKWINQCFSCLRASTIPVNTIVIDNCSSDNSVNIISKTYPEVDLIKSTKNLGFGKANNIGIKKAYSNGADYVLLLNQDAWIEPDTIEKIITQHQKNNTFDIISPIHLDGTGSKLDFNFSTYINSYDCKDFISDVFMNQLQQKLYEIKFVNAACWMLTRKCIETVGGFNPFFYHYGEDNNYVDRLHFHNLRMGLCSTAKIFHDRDQVNTSVYFNKEERSNRLKMLKYLNPNTVSSINDDISSLKKSVFYFLLTFRFKKAFTVYRELSNLKSLYSQILDNLKLTTSKGLTFLVDL